MPAVQEVAEAVAERTETKSVVAATGLIPEFAPAAVVPGLEATTNQTESTNDYPYLDGLASMDAVWPVLCYWPPRLDRCGCPKKRLQAASPSRLHVSPRPEASCLHRRRIDPPALVSGCPCFVGLVFQYGSKKPPPACATRIGGRFVFTRRGCRTP